MSRFAYTVPIQRVRAFATLAARRGWDFDSLMRSAGMSPRLLAEDRSRVTPQQVGALVNTLLRATDDELFGLGPAPVPPGTFRMLGYALVGADDLREMFTRLQSFQRALPGIPSFRVSTQGTTASLTIDISTITRPVDFLVDTLLAATHRTMGWATNSRIRLQRVEVPHPHDPNVDDYDVIFGAPIVFDAAQPGLVFAASVLASPIMRRDNDWEDFLCHAVEDIIARRDYAVSLADRVRRIMAQAPEGPWPSADEVAARLAMSPQTVRRKLREENTSLTQIREDILRDAAITSLAAGQETVAALSQRLGFSEPSAFIRAFRRWTGTSPGTYRRKALR